MSRMKLKVLNSSEDYVSQTRLPSFISCIARSVGGGPDALDITNFIKLFSPYLIGEFSTINQAEKNFIILEKWSASELPPPPLAAPVFFTLYIHIIYIYIFCYDSANTQNYFKNEGLLTFEKILHDYL